MSADAIARFRFRPAHTIHSPRTAMASSRSSSHVALSNSFYGSTLIPVATGSNGGAALPDPVLRTKMLLMGMRRCARLAVHGVVC